MIALLMVIIALWKIWPRPLFRQRSYEERQAFIRQFARLTLLGATALTVYFYVTSPNSAKWPQFNDRYLIGVLIALPAVIWPLWADIRTTSVSGRLFAAARSTILALFALALLAGTLRVFALVPDAQQAYQQRTALISYLQRLDVKHIYSEYWTCNAISFQSNEQVICAVIDGAGNPIDNRYVPYVSMVQGDPHAAYVVPSGSAQAAMLAERSAQKKAYYQHFTFGGYEIYLPQSGHF